MFPKSRACGTAVPNIAITTPLRTWASKRNILAQANEFLNSYIKKFNAKFALEITHTKSVFEIQPAGEIINLTLAVLVDCKIDCGHCVRFNTKYCKYTDSSNNPIYFSTGTDALVIKAFYGDLFVSIGNKVYALEEVPSHLDKSKNFDFTQDKPKKRKSYVPPMSHPLETSIISSIP